MPQGSVLQSLFFLIFINDQDLAALGGTRKLNNMPFADDCALYRSTSCKEDALCTTTRKSAQFSNLERDTTERNAKSVASPQRKTYIVCHPCITYKQTFETVDSVKYLRII
jgi:hypothetical protein